MASEAAKMAFRGYMHIDAMLIEVAHFKSEVRMGIHHLTIQKPQHAGLGGHFPLVPSLFRRDQWPTLILRHRRRGPPRSRRVRPCACAMAAAEDRGLDFRGRGGR